MKKTRKKRYSAVVQTHHIRYGSLDGTIPEITVNVWKGEHFILTLMGRRKRISKGFIEALKDYILRNEQTAEALTKMVGEK